MFFVSYYICVLLCVSFYLYAFKRYKLELISYSSVLYAFAVIFAFIPGYFVANGSVIKDRSPWLYEGFKEDVYFLFIFYMFITTVGLVIGRIVTRGVEGKLETRPYPYLRISFLLLVIAGYAAAYFSWLPEIPLHKALLGGGKDSISISRLNILYAIGEGRSVPMAFGYWRAILQPLLLFVFLFYFNRVYKGEKKNYFFIFILGLFLSYCGLYAAEKGIVIYYLIAMIMLFSMGREIDLKYYLKASAAAFVILFVLYVSFMKVDPLTAPLSIMKRISLQTASYYIQSEMIQEGYLWFDNIHMNYLNESTVSPNEWAYKKIYSMYASKGHVGSAGGLSLGKLFLSFGWWSTLVYFFIVIIYGFFDGLILGIINSAKNREIDRKILKCFYIATSSFYAPALLTSVFLIFEIPTIVPRNLYPILACYLFLFRVESYRIQIPTSWSFKGLSYD